MKIGVLALQGGFRAHEKALESCGVETVRVKKPAHLESIAGLVLPGGESTTQVRLLERYDFPSVFGQWKEEGKPLFGTCAGVILMARKIAGRNQTCYNFLDIEVSRNAYGTQKESFEGEVEAPFLGEEPLKGVFIRAPQIVEIGPEVEVLARHRGKAVIVRYKQILGATFHPELTTDFRLHQYFLKICREALSEKIG